MRARAIGWMVAAALMLGSAGCAVGRFIAGAPSSREATPRQALLVRRCGGCHEIPDPAAMSAAQWRASLDRMRIRVQLPASEWDSLAAMARDGDRP